MLFHKRTKKVIKIVWGVFASLIMLSMIITYSGFTLLARTSSPTPTYAPSPTSTTAIPSAVSTTSAPTNSAPVVATNTPPTSAPTPEEKKLHFSL